MKQQITFCNGVCPWAVKQAKQASTWRGLAIGVGTLVTVINPALGATILKAVAGVVATIDVLKDDSK